jgi:hypothetical protein
VTNFGEPPASPQAPVVTVGGSAAGEVLAGRYRLEEHVNDDARGRQVWRATDIVLRRPVAVVLRHPGGDFAAEMTMAAVAASRITHSHLVDVYDVFDEGSRAYVIREWVDGLSLREIVADGPLDAGRATAVAHAVASAVAAAHATGTSHGNIQPGTVLIADDGRVMLGDGRADDSVTPEGDVRALGAVLYCALTGRWPHLEAGPDQLPDGARDATGRLISPRQMRSGLPANLCDLATGLLDPTVTVPTAESVAVELGRLDTDGHDELFGEGGSLSFAPPGRRVGAETTSRAGRKITIGIGALVILAAAAFVIAHKIGGSQTAGTSPTTHPTSTQSVAQPHVIALNPGQVRIVDPPNGDRGEIGNSQRMIDGKESTDWHTGWYKEPNFGGIKPGMGVLIDLGKPTDVVNLRADFGYPGATAQIEIGDTDPGATSAGDQEIVNTYQPVGQAQQVHATQVFPIGKKARYVLLWITVLPPSQKYPGKFQISIDEISVSVS